MKYEQIDRKMPPAMKERIIGQAWCSSLRTQGDRLADVLTSPSHLSILNEKLSSDERRTLRLILSTFGCLSFTGERLEKEAAQHMAGAQVSLGLMGLRQYGIIVAFRKAWGEQLFVLPEDAFAGWQSLLLPSFSTPIENTDRDCEFDVLAVGDVGEDSRLNEEEVVNPRGLAQQLFHFMVACSRQSSLSLTNKGTLHKKQLLKLTEHVSLPKRILTMAGLTYAFTDVYDEPSALIIEMAIQMGFLLKNEAGDALIIDEDAFQAWLTGSYDRQQAQLYQIWRQALIPAPVWLEHGIALMEQAEAADGQWFELDKLVQVIQACCSTVLGGQRGMDNTVDTALRPAFISAWVQPLSVFRFLEVGKDEHEHVWLRWLISPRQQNTCETAVSLYAHQTPSLYVQPDYELLLPPDASLFTEWEVAAFADIQHSDLVRTYRLTKESFQRALDHGLQSAEVIQMLQRNAYYEVPAGLIISLQQWEEQKDKLYLEEVTLLRCQSADIADALLRNEKCRPFLGERIGEANFIVSRDVLKLLTKCLESMGFHPNRSITKKLVLNVEEAPSLTEPTRGLCYSRDTIQLYDIDPHLPQRDDLYPDMLSIPTSWTKEFRDYHASTRKDIIRKAIEWRSVLQLRKEGRDCFIIPRMLREDRTGWLLEGWEEHRDISWQGDEWNEMKLILPGINDAGVREKEETLGEL
ncbi:hypothetical protein A8709_23640 [Paenibacillus pectinilyticus]|uniref:Helicase XPB/Ssl2 N-terminal domain-containing protein n=1 Tax=Paenibacillus pectinilyticus TaxID=512399 RepID=A0A1C1A8R3_9BACL|nr:helicase-associated domain-containing protein [Paenibacillus pectinilyticus]OCT16992.1 hypothetical protein A8709_23640 [Paenibacillus pectinilyticus]